MADLQEQEVAGGVSCTPKKSRWQRLWVRGLLGIPLSYAAIVAVGLIPVNNDFQEADENDAITIYVTSNAVHADIIVPTKSDVIDWRVYFPASDFAAKSNHYSHVAFGWGDRGFYLNTPEWKDLKWSTATNALFWPSATVMHVQWAHPQENEHTRAVTISAEAYERLTAYILNSFRPNEPASGADDRIGTLVMAASYNRWDAFYEAQGRYHLFNTCNCWVADGLKTSGVRVPWFSPMPKTVFWYLPD